jgi:hypothetical protein
VTKAAHAIPPEHDRPKKDRFTLYTDSEFGNEIRNAVTSIPGMTFSELATEALRQHLERLRKQINRGRPWGQRRKSKLRTGRPLLPK